MKKTLKRPPTKQEVVDMMDLLIKAFSSIKDDPKTLEKIQKKVMEKHGNEENNRETPTQET